MGYYSTGVQYLPFELNERHQDLHTGSADYQHFKTIRSVLVGTVVPKTHMLGSRVTVHHK